MPGTLVEGKILDSIRDLGASLDGFAQQPTGYDGSANFGAPKKSTGREARKALRVSDLRMTSPEKSNAVDRTRIALDPVLGTVIPGHLQVIEQVHAAGEEIVFEGHVRVADKAPSALLARAEKALQWNTQFGALRSAGFGKLKSAKFVDTKQDGGNFTDIDENNPPLHLVLELHLQDLLCVGEKRTASNTYNSADQIPGAAIKGAIANQILTYFGLGRGFLADHVVDLTRDLKELASQFSELTVSHATPIKDAGDTLPQAAPEFFSALVMTITILTMLHNWLILTKPFFTTAKRRSFMASGNNRKELRCSLNSNKHRRTEFSACVPP